MAAKTANDFRRKRYPADFRRSAMRHGRDRPQLVLRTFQCRARPDGVWKKSAGLRCDGRPAHGRSERQRVSLTQSFKFNMGRKLHRYGALDALSAHYRAETFG